MMSETTKLWNFEVGKPVANETSLLLQHDKEFSSLNFTLIDPKPTAFIIITMEGDTTNSLIILKIAILHLRHTTWNKNVLKYTSNQTYFLPFFPTLHFLRKIYRFITMALPYFYILIISEGIRFMWKMTFEIFIKSLRFETPWVRKNGFYESVCLSVCL